MSLLTIGLSRAGRAGLRAFFGAIWTEVFEILPRNFRKFFAVAKFSVRSRVRLLHISRFKMTPSLAAT